VALVGVICDKPAANKASGFGSHSHRLFCSRCNVTQDDKGTPAAYQKGDQEHRAQGDIYATLKTQTAKNAHIKDHASRYSALSLLPYFDLVCMTVIDPMHTLFLGLVKTQWYDIWVKQEILRPKKELQAFHGLLSLCEIPSFTGRLPTLVGESHGRSMAYYGYDCGANNFPADLVRLHGR